MAVPVPRIGNALLCSPNALLGEDGRKRKMFYWDEDTAGTKPGQVL